MRQKQDTDGGRCSSFDRGLCSLASVGPSLWVPRHYWGKYVHVQNKNEERPRKNPSRTADHSRILNGGFSQFTHNIRRSCSIFVVACYQLLSFYYIMLVLVEKFGGIEG